MSSKKKYVIEKGGVRAVATDLTLAGLKDHGWTVVEDGSSETGQDSSPVENVEQTHFRARSDEGE